MKTASAFLLGVVITLTAGASFAPPKGPMHDGELAMMILNIDDAVRRNDLKALKPVLHRLAHACTKAN
jgi:hypothetical protein